MSTCPGFENDVTRERALGHRPGGGGNFLCRRLFVDATRGVSVSVSVAGPYRVAGPGHNVGP